MPIQSSKMYSDGSTQVIIKPQINTLKADGTTLVDDKDWRIVGKNYGNTSVGAEGSDNVYINLASFDEHGDNRDVTLTFTKGSYTLSFLVNCRYEGLLLYVDNIRFASKQEEGQYYVLLYNRTTLEFMKEYILEQLKALGWGQGGVFGIGQDLREWKIGSASGSKMGEIKLGQ